MTPRSPRPKVIFFDAAGTLIHLPKGAAWHYREVALRHGLDLEETQLATAFRTAWKSTPPPTETRKQRADDDKSWWRGLVERVLDECSVATGEGRDVLFESLYSEFEQPGIWELYPETVEVLTQLSKNFRLGIISNFDRRLVKVLEHENLKHLFEPIVLSSEVGADKPARWIYEQALLKVGVSSSEALHVGDDPECDWQGAATAGLQVFRLDRPRNSLRELLETLRA